MDILLIPGHWLGAWAWDQVVEQLREVGYNAMALTLPGLDAQDAQRSCRTLDEQAAAIEHALVQATAAGYPLAAIVAHSGANAPVSMVLDRHSALIRRVIWVDSGPIASGSVFAPDAPADIDELPLPTFEALGQQASLEGLSSADLDRFRRLAVPEPGPVLRQEVTLTNDARLHVPTTLVCCSISSEMIQELVTAGHPMFSEVGRLTRVTFLDLPTGHWPMWSRPADLAQVIVAEVSPARQSCAS